LAAYNVDERGDLNEGLLCSSA
ncbi:MAG: hypothetical protein H6Q63_1371, partial [Firmicutes bacterium]|nr:hypothetical protein [Bacillota bacterium]